MESRAISDYQITAFGYYRSDDVAAPPHNARLNRQNTIGDNLVFCFASQRFAASFGGRVDLYNCSCATTVLCRRQSRLSCLAAVCDDVLVIRPWGHSYSCAAVTVLWRLRLSDCDMLHNTRMYSQVPRRRTGVLRPAARPSGWRWTCWQPTESTRSWFKVIPIPTLRSPASRWFTPPTRKPGRLCSMTTGQTRFTSLCCNYWESQVKYCDCR